MWSDSLLAGYTTGIRPAFRLVSRLYRTGYNALLVVVPMLVILPLLPSLTPFLASVQVQASRYSVVKVRLFQHNQHKTKGAFVIFEKLLRFFLSLRGWNNYGEIIIARVRFLRANPGYSPTRCSRVRWLPGIDCCKLYAGLLLCRCLSQSLKKRR